MALTKQHRVLGTDAEALRTTIIDGMLAHGGLEKFFYVDEDTCAGWCPVCGTGTLSVYFHGLADRADLVCGQDCDEGDILRALTRLAGVR